MLNSTRRRGRGGYSTTIRERCTCLLAKRKERHAPTIVGATFRKTFGASSPTAHGPTKESSHCFALKIPRKKGREVNKQTNKRQSLRTEHMPRFCQITCIYSDRFSTENIRLSPGGTRTTKPERRGGRGGGGWGGWVKPPNFQVILAGRTFILWLGRASQAVANENKNNSTITKNKNMALKKNTTTTTTNSKQAT